MAGQYCHVVDRTHRPFSCCRFRSLKAVCVFERVGLFAAKCLFVSVFIQADKGDASTENHLTFYLFFALASAAVGWVGGKS